MTVRDPKINQSTPWSCPGSQRDGEMGCRSRDEPGEVALSCVHVTGRAFLFLFWCWLISWPWKRLDDDSLFRDMMMASVNVRPFGPSCAVPPGPTWPCSPGPPETTPRNSRLFEMSLYIWEYIYYLLQDVWSVVRCKHVNVPSRNRDLFPPYARQR